MKHLLKLSLVFMVMTISGCVDIFDDVETLVYGYTDMTWRLRTKATERIGTLDLLYASNKIMGNNEWEDVDHIIFFDMASVGCSGTLFSSTSNEEVFYSLCNKHGDTEKSPVGCFRQISKSERTFYYFYKDFSALEVTSEEDFDSDHPAGSSLLDIIHYATDTPFRVLRNNYQTKFEDNSLTILAPLDSMYLAEYYGGVPVYWQYFNTFKKGTDVKPEDMTILGDFYISFDKLPDVIAPKHIRIRMTADDGDVFNFETILTFDKVKTADDVVSM